MNRTLEGERLRGVPACRLSGREAAPGGRTLDIDRLLTAPGHRSATHDARLTMADGRIAAIDVTDGPGRNGRIALPAMVNAHDHGYGVRPLALGGADDALECWIASLSRVTVEPRLEAAIAFGRMVLAGIGATVHCHNSLVADQMEQALPPGRLFDAACRHGFRRIDGSDDYGDVVPGARADRWCSTTRRPSRAS